MSRSGVEVYDTTPELLAEVVARAREIDRLEARYQTGRPLERAAWTAYSLSTMSKVGFYYGKPVNVWGVHDKDLFGGIGVPWLIATDEIKAAAVPFLRESCYYLNEMKEGREALENEVWSENRVAIHWLKWLGFRMGETVERNDQPFIKFSWRREECVPGSK